MSNEDLPAPFITRWGKWARNKDYLLAEKFHLETSRFKNLQIPVLSYGFDDDTYAPREALKKLHNSLEKAEITDRYIRAKEIHSNGIGHFGYFKETCSHTIWEETITWLLKF